MVAIATSGEHLQHGIGTGFGVVTDGKLWFPLAQSAQG